MDRVAILGHSPGKTRIEDRPSPTLKRLYRWMDECEVHTFSFMNLVGYHAPDLKLKDIDTDFVCQSLSGYKKVVALGGLATKFCERNGINHIAAPHPSPRNRKFNDKAFEPAFINTLKEYLNG